jgi:hypothetical protein
MEKKDCGGKGTFWRGRFVTSSACLGLRLLYRDHVLATGSALRIVFMRAVCVARVNHSSINSHVFVSGFMFRV